MKQKINLRLIILSLVAMLATVFSVTVVFYGILQRQVRSDLKLTAQMLKDTHYFEILDPDSVESEDITLSTDNEDLRITWINADGKVLYDNDAEAASLENHLDRPEIQAAFEKGSGESVRRSDTLNMNTYYYAILLDNGTVLRIACKANSIQAVFMAALPTILVIMAIIIVVCVWLSHVMTRQLIDPIERMAEQMENNNVEPTYKELQPFANMIRKQHEDILASAKIRQDFTANVSHELKTPLTAISGYAELIEHHMVSGDQQEHFIREIRKNADRLLSLINDIIRLSELDHAESTPQFEELNLNEVVGDCMNNLQINAEQRRILLTYEGEDCRVHGNRDMLRELTDNLVQNAIRYNNEGGHVWVSVAVENGNPTLTVKDDGIGIAKEEQKRIFERFYRVDKSRSRATGGTGLGLAIVKHIAELHDAIIELDSDLGKGTKIRIVM